MAKFDCWAQRADHLHRRTYTAEQVIVSAHAVGSSKLLHQTEPLSVYEVQEVDGSIQIGA